MNSDHTADDHDITGSPYERMRRILARHLCGWISGHGVQMDGFLPDADLIMREAHEGGLRFHLAPTDGSMNASDGFLDVMVNRG